MFCQLHACNNVAFPTLCLHVTSCRCSIRLCPPWRECSVLSLCRSSEESKLLVPLLPMFFFFFFNMKSQSCFTFSLFLCCAISVCVHMHISVCVWMCWFGVYLEVFCFFLRVVAAEAVEPKRNCGAIKLETHPLYKSLAVWVISHGVTESPKHV